MRQHLLATTVLAGVLAAALGGCQSVEQSAAAPVLSLAVVPTLASVWLVPRLAKLFARYPDLKIDLMLEERLLDLPMREADVAIRMKEPSQQDLIRRRLLNIRMRLYATPEYLASAGTPPGRNSVARPPRQPTIVDSSPTGQAPPSTTAAIRPSRIRTLMCGCAGAPVPSISTAWR